MVINKDLIVVGTSAGGIEALKVLTQGLPADLDAAVCIVMHLAPDAPSQLAEILQRTSTLPVTQAASGEPIRKGHVYVARPDYHLVVEEEHIALARGPRENRNRPAIDALFRSAAYTHSGRVIGVVLTGALDDGTAGLWTVKERGGTAVVQDPAEAEFPSMPESALKHVTADHVVPMVEMGPLLARLTHDAAMWAGAAASKELEIETRIAKETRALQLGVMGLGPTTPYTCPDCHGVLIQVKAPGIRRFRCHTGHAYSINTLLAAVTEYVEDSLWNCVRAIEESSMLLQQIGSDVRAQGEDEVTASLFERKARETDQHAEIVRHAAMEHQTLSRDNIHEVKSFRR